MLSDFGRYRWATSYSNQTSTTPGDLDKSDELRKILEELGGKTLLNLDSLQDKVFNTISGMI